MKKNSPVGDNTMAIPSPKSDFSDWVDSDPNELNQIKYRRKLGERIFVNRSLSLENIEYYGFDMDYTLAVYNSPEYENLVVRLSIEKLITKGYPEAIRSIRFDPEFPIRGLLLDKKFGHLLKVDNFGYILSCVHGKRRLSKEETYKFYPDKVIHSEDIGTRFHSLDTLFDRPEASLFADLIEFVESDAGGSFICASAGDTNNDVRDINLNYVNIFNDVRTSVDGIHQDGSLKKEIIANLDKYVRKDPRMPLLLHRLRSAGKKIFLLTNSEYFYTNAVMAYMLEGMRPEYANWREYFDIVIVSARKPLFFGEGTALREVNLENGTLKFTHVRERFERGKVYNGGNLAIFQELTGIKGSEVLYIGDNIYHDIIRTKKSRCLWRTLLIVRELDNEIATWNRCRKQYNFLLNLEYIRAEVYKNTNSETTEKPDVSVLRAQMKKTVQEMDREFNKYFGSLFRTGANHSFFSAQVKRYADIYASDYLNLLSYPFFYYFSAMQTLMPHEEESIL